MENSEEKAEKPVPKAMKTQFGSTNTDGTAIPKNPELSYSVIPQPNKIKTTPAKAKVENGSQLSLDLMPPLNLPVQRAKELPSIMGLNGGFTIPKLRSASGVPLKQPKLNTSLLNQWRNQNYSLNKPQIKHDQEECETISMDASDGTSQAIDLTSAVIISDKDKPPRETATAAARLKQKQNKQHFKMHFNPIDNRRARLTDEITMEHRLNANIEKFGQLTPSCTKDAAESALGILLAKVMPLKPFLKYAATSDELQNLKIYKSANYGQNIKRFLFDTSSPDQLVKESLKKSNSITRN